MTSGFSRGVNSDIPPPETKQNRSSTIGNTGRMSVLTNRRGGADITEQHYRGRKMLLLIT